MNGVENPPPSPFFKGGSHVVTLSTSIFVKMLSKKKSILDESDLIRLLTYHAFNANMAAMIPNISQIIQSSL